MNHTAYDVMREYMIEGAELDGLIDTSELFNCELCRKHFNCIGDGDFDECSRNYEKYALSETER